MSKFNYKVLYKYEILYIYIYINNTPITYFYYFKESACIFFLHLVELTTKPLFQII